LAPEDVSLNVFCGLGNLPHFNPELDKEPPLVGVVKFRSQLRRSAGVLFASPEYAHGVPGVLKNALDWVVASGELYEKPVALFSASPRAGYAQASLVETLTVMSAKVVPEACILVPRLEKNLDENGGCACKCPEGGTDYTRKICFRDEPAFMGDERREEFAAALNLEVDQLSRDLPLEAVSTGLRYLIVLIVEGLKQARIVKTDFEGLPRTVNAQFSYVLDVQKLEGRHWNNDGVMEDIATGSGAGTVGAHLTKHGRATAGDEFILRQGRFLGRPSEIRVRSEGTRAEITRVQVGGDVALVGRGVLDAAPEVQE
jgi:hypothetical protein